MPGTWLHVGVGVVHGIFLVRDRDSADCLSSRFGPVNLAKIGVSARHWSVRVLELSA